jgi:hypothetical protein
MQDVLIRVQEKEREEKNDYTDLLFSFFLLNPKLWMQDVLIRVQEKEREEKNDYTDLLPFNWKG